MSLKVLELESFSNRQREMVICPHCATECVPLDDIRLFGPGVLLACRICLGFFTLGDDMRPREMTEQELNEIPKEAREFQQEMRDKTTC